MIEKVQKPIKNEKDFFLNKTLVDSNNKNYLMQKRIDSKCEK
jgi:hypothetical protein